MSRCGYESCPHKAVDGKALCIFHLPIEEKSVLEFWKHLANYYLALLGSDPTSYLRLRKDHPASWILNARDDTLLAHYKEMPRGTVDIWSFSGFVFPQMTEEHDLTGLTFVSADFSMAQFAGRADFSETWFLANMSFYKAHFLGGAHFSGTKFSSSVDFTDARFSGGAYFSRSEFWSEVRLERAEFSGDADFTWARFRGRTLFLAAQFSTGADFSSTQFLNGGDLRWAKFSGWADFQSVEFTGPARFGGTTFAGGVDFSEAQFSDEAGFDEAELPNGADFSGSRFSGPVSFAGAALVENKPEDRAVLDLTGCTLRNRMSFDGTEISERALVLLWNLSFAHGVSRVEIERDASLQLSRQKGEEAKSGRFRGRIIEPAGEVVFRDIPRGMSRVSFLHSDVYTDRPYIRFFNVHWEKDPARFLHDAGLVFRRQVEWQTLLPHQSLESAFAILGLFRLSPEPEADSAAHDDGSADLVRLIRLDVERVAREIRRFYEDYRSYPDAGDYYVAEMDYRRVQKSWRRNFFTRLVLEVYKRVSSYGESPVRAMGWLLGIILFFALAFLFTGFRFLGLDIQRVPSFELPRILDTLRDYGRAVLFALASFIPGYFRLQTERLASISEATTVLSFVEALFGVTTLTLFLLAIRRRFRR